MHTVVSLLYFKIIWKVWIACVLIAVYYWYIPDVKTSFCISFSLNSFLGFSCVIIWILTQCLVYFLCTRRSCLAVEFCWLAVKIRCCSAECLAVSGFLQFAAVAGVVEVKQHLQKNSVAEALSSVKCLLLCYSLESWSILNYTDKLCSVLWFLDSSINLLLITFVLVS